jgi:eukaryotic-like serine/threonine-protein kinase
MKYSANLSIDPSGIGALSEEQQQRLVDVLDGYLRALDAGVPPYGEALLAAHPDLADVLRTYLSQLDRLHDMAAGFAAPDESTDSTAVDQNGEVAPMQLGDFILEREIGRGGMGVVYEARQVSLQRRVAVKVLPFASVLDAKQIARFRNEAQAAAQLHHPHIVPVFAVGIERGVHYYAMQLVAGRPLDQVIEELREAGSQGVDVEREGLRTVENVGCGERLNEYSSGTSTERFQPLRSSHESATYFQAIAQLGVQAAEALHAAHELGIVHRDIKPSNLLLESSGKLWVTDFGLARFRHDGTLTRSGDIVGTMRYMSPEQAAGHTALVDHRSDIYSLAATLYELLTLRPAIDGSTAAQLLRAIDHQEPPRLTRVRPDIPRDLETIVRKSMAKSREDRYATAQELADDLRRFQAGEPIRARPPSLADRLGKWTVAHARLVFTSAALCLVVGAAGAVATVLVMRESREAEHNLRRAEKNFSAARNVVDRFGAGLAERLAEVPGADSIRQDLLTETIGYYREFVEQAEGDPQLRVDLALAYSKLGTLLEDRGSLTEALEAHERARALWARLAADSPGSRDHRQHLALGWSKLAGAFAAAGRFDEARDAQNAAIRIQMQLADEFVADASCRSDLAQSYCHLGTLETRAGDEPAARVAFELAVKLQCSLCDQEPGQGAYQQELAQTLNNFAGLYAETNPPRALELFSVAVTHLRKALLLQPDNELFQQDLASTYCNLGSIRARTGAKSLALQDYADAREIQEKRVAAAPARRTLQRDLAVTNNNEGLLLSELGRPGEAILRFQQAIAAQESLLAQSPADIALRSNLAGVHNNLGIALESARRFDEAVGQYERAIEQQREAFAAAPHMARYRQLLSKHYFNFGRALRNLGRGEEAGQAALARRALWDRDSQHLLAVAEELALAAALLDEQSDREFNRKYCELLALETLRQAVAAGLSVSRELATNEAFAALRGDQQFQALLTQ